MSTLRLRALRERCHGAEATRLEGVRLEAVDLETDLSEADTAVSDFFAVDRPGLDFADSGDWR